MPKKQLLTSILNAYTFIGVCFLVIAFMLILVPIAPNVIYAIYPDASRNEQESLVKNLDADRKGFEESRESSQQEAEEEFDTRPPFNENLPEENTILVNGIGVDAPIEQGSDWDSALEEGPWIVDNFGTPDNQFAPVIIASHRFGGIGWDSKKRETHSFYSLPDLKAGDKISIIWEQREYKYEVYELEEDTEITDYEADLILYTCKLLWESPVRYFVYAERVD